MEKYQNEWYIIMTHDNIELKSLPTPFENAT
jgi:hypothetical protein